MVVRVNFRSEPLIDNRYPSLICCQVPLHGLSCHCPGHSPPYHPTGPWDILVPPYVRTGCCPCPASGYIALLWHVQEVYDK